MQIMKMHLFQPPDVQCDVRHVSKFWMGEEKLTVRAMKAAKTSGTSIPTLEHPRTILFTTSRISSMIGAIKNK